MKTFTSVVLKSKSSSTTLTLVTAHLKETYTIVFDAGSTGTRVHVFTLFIENNNDVKLKSEQFKEVNPGIGYYFKNPEDAGLSLIPLLNFSETIVPENVRRETFVQLKATAGLRLLRENETEAILASVRSTLSQYSYKTNKYSVSMLDASAEGTNAWLTINFLLDKMHPSKETVAVIDLGGGSTQVTFQVKQNANIYSPQFQVNKNFIDLYYTLYTRSYLGNGLRSARKQILTRNVPFLVASETLHISHACIPKGTHAKWFFEGITYFVNSSEENNCYETIASFVNKNGKEKIEQTSILNEQNIYAISHYYEIAVLIDAIDLESKSGILSVGDYLEYAKSICPQSFQSSADNAAAISETQRDKYLSRHAFICLDLTYIT
ncbi:ectonucleoside triphosphate diphosphohydrolase 5-like isoform X1, partial [Leptotrombidium deliense]